MKATSVGLIGLTLIAAIAGGWQLGPLVVGQQLSPTSVPTAGILIGIALGLGFTARFFWKQSGSTAALRSVPLAGWRRYALLIAGVATTIGVGGAYLADLVTGASPGRLELVSAVGAIALLAIGIGVSRTR
jgi:hypothetical protein